MINIAIVYCHSLIMHKLEAIKLIMNCEVQQCHLHILNVLLNFPGK